MKNLAPQLLRKQFRAILGTHHISASDERAFTRWSIAASP